MHVILDSMYQRIILSFFIPFAINLSAQDSIQKEVTFNLFAPGLADSVQVYITGGHPNLGNWHPGKIKMQKIGKEHWQYSINLSQKISIEYKYTLGSFDNEGVNQQGNPFPNFVLNPGKSTSTFDTIKYWKESGKPGQTYGQITGTVKYHLGLNGDSILARDLIVWLPPDYDEKNKYPVLYMHDGQNLFDPKTSAFGIDWQVDESLDSLIKADAVEPMIVVGIYNTSDRMKEYIPGPKGDAYMKFIVEQVKPLIDKDYSTRPEREYTLVGGSSAGGTISFMMLWNYSNTFSKAICMSPAFKIQEIDVVKDVLNHEGERKEFKIYIDNGGVGLEEKLQPGIDEMMEALQKKGYRLDEDIFYLVDEKAQHSEPEWAKRFPDAIVKLADFNKE